MFYIDAEMATTLLTPHHCICPNESYTCRVSNGLHLKWISDVLDMTELLYTVSTTTDEVVYTGPFRVAVSYVGYEPIMIIGNFTSHIWLIDLNANGTDLTCEGGTFMMGEIVTTNDTVTVCVVGRYQNVSSFLF